MSTEAHKDDFRKEPMAPLFRVLVAHFFGPYCAYSELAAQAVRVCLAEDRKDMQCELWTVGSRRTIERQESCRRLSRAWRDAT